MTKRILLLVLVFILIYLGLYWVAFSPGGRMGTAQFLQRTTMTVFRPILPKVFLYPQILEEGNRTVNSIGFVSQADLELLKEEAKRQGKTNLNFELRDVRFYVDYFTIPYLFLVTLILVTTLPWKPKLLAILWGSLLFVAFYLVKMFLFTLAHISEASIGVYDMGTAWEERLRAVLPILEINFSFFAAMVIWLLVAFKNSNWREVLFR